MRVAVYGNITYDHIITIDTKLTSGASHRCEKSSRVGGVGNFCRAVTKNDLYDLVVVSCIGHDQAGTKALDDIQATEYAISVSHDDPTSEAWIIVDGMASIRTSFVKWGACFHKKDWKPIEDADWHHFMYLDEMNITAEQLKQFKGVLSADFVDSSSLRYHLDRITLLDYLIIAGSPQLPDSFEHLTKRGVIIHEPTHSRSSGNKIRDQYQRTETQPYLNVLGAGDYFAALCIANLLQDGSNPNLRKVNSDVLSLLKDQS